MKSESNFKPESGASHGAEPAKGADADGLSFDALRRANTARLPQFKNKHGLPAHSMPDGSDWSDAQWLQAVVGELGEYANLKKKVDRGDISREEAQPMLADELADVATYLDILAFRLGVDLGAAVADKFNRISIRVGSTVRLAVSASRAARSLGSIKRWRWTENGMSEYGDGAFVWFSDYTMLDRASPIKAEVTTGIDPAIEDIKSVLRSTGHHYQANVLSNVIQSLAYRTSPSKAEGEDAVTSNSHLDWTRAMTPDERIDAALALPRRASPARGEVTTGEAELLREIDTRITNSRQQGMVIGDFIPIHLDLLTRCRAMIESLIAGRKP